MAYSSAGGPAGAPPTGRQALIARGQGRALGSPGDTGCPPGFVFLGGDCVPGTAQFQPGTMRKAIQRQRAVRAKVVSRGR